MDNETYPIWIEQIIRKVWALIKNRWKFRNALTYGNKNNNNKRETILLRIDQIYSKMDKLRVQDQFLFQYSLKEWDMKSITQMKLWIRRIILFIKYFLKNIQIQNMNFASNIQKFMVNKNSLNAVIKNY